MGNIDIIKTLFDKLPDYNWIAKDATGDTYFFIYEPYFNEVTGAWEIDNLPTNHCLKVRSLDFGLMTSDPDKQILSRMDISE